MLSFQQFINLPASREMMRAFTTMHSEQERPSATPQTFFRNAVSGIGVGHQRDAFEDDKGVTWEFQHVFATPNKPEDNHF